VPAAAGMAGRITAYKIIEWPVSCKGHKYIKKINMTKYLLICNLFPALHAGLNAVQAQAQTNLPYT
jgi:hypothetical protein